MMTHVQITAIEDPAIAASDTMKNKYRTLDMANRWSRILTVNAGDE